MTQTEQDNTHVRQLISSVLALGTARATEVIERIRVASLEELLLATPAMQEFRKEKRPAKVVDLTTDLPEEEDIKVVETTPRKRSRPYFKIRRKGSQPEGMTFLDAVTTILQERGQSTGKQIEKEINRRGWKFRVRHYRAYISHLASTHKDHFVSVQRGVYRAANDSRPTATPVEGKKLRDRLLKVVEDKPFIRATALYRTLGANPSKIVPILNDLTDKGVLKVEKLHGHRCYGLTAPVS